jgi:hypothetical protein
MVTCWIGFQSTGVNMAKVSGPFDVKIVPAREDDKAEGSTLGRLTLEKQLHGELEATSRGEMLTAMTSIKTSAGYVAIERVTGTLQGRRGSFVLQHSGTMTSQGQHLTVSVVPDSGTGELLGLSGTMAIRIADGKHFYDFEYLLPETA